MDLNEQSKTKETIKFIFYLKEIMTTKTTPTKSATKICPFCANKINAKAIKCQFCKEFLDDELDPVVKNQIEKTSS
jgi:hypothetical protein